MSKHIRNTLIAVAAMSLGLISTANADVIRVTESNFLAGSGLITFDEVPLGTVNPHYDPAEYGGDAGAPSVDFGGFFVGQQISDNPASDCPGATATGCVVGTPTDPLTLDSSAPDTFTVNDASSNTNPVLSGSPTFAGPVAILFSNPVVGVGLKGGFFDAVNSTQIAAYTATGDLIGSVTNTQTGFEFFGLMTASGQPLISGLLFSLVADEPAGFAIDNLRFAEVGEIAPTPTGVPAPGTAALLSLGLLLILAFCRRYGYRA